MRKQGNQQRSWMAAKKEKKGQPSMTKDGCKKRKKKGSKKDKKVPKRAEN